MMKTRLLRWLRALLSFLMAPLGRLPGKWQEKFLEASMAALSRATSTFHTFHVRPQRADDVATDPPLLPAERIAIVMQGPLVLADRFTEQTVRLYQRTFPGSVIIVSTWQNQDAATLDALRQLGAVVVTSPMPASSGGANVTYQMVSTMAGLRAAAAAGVEYAVKTRCDQRFYASGLVPYWLALLRQFPLGPRADLGFRQRIIGLNINTARYRPYSYSDIFQFGLLEDLLKLWDLPLDPRSLSPAEIWRSAPKVIDLARLKVGENYIYISYMEKIGRPLDFSYRDHFHLLKEQFIVIDKESLDLFCPRYGYAEYRVAADPKYAANRVFAKINFADWLAIYQNDLDALMQDPAMLQAAEA